MKNVLAFAAVGDSATGTALLRVPSLVGQWLFGAELPGQQIVVEGFTDNVPIRLALKARFPSNWELTCARATEVLRFLVCKGVPQNTTSAQGFGDSPPVTSNDTAEGRAKNRRAGIVIMAAGRP